MAEQTYWIGSLGPFKFDDADSVLDLDPADPRSTYGGVGTPDQKAIVTTGQLYVETAPTASYHVLREDDIGGIVGDVSGPAGATDGAVALFDGATGKLLKDSGITAFGEILGDGTAGRVLRVVRLRIIDGTNANTINCQTVSYWNGDANGATDNVSKGATTGNFTLSAAGSVLTIEAAGLTGNCVMAFGVNSFNASTTALTVEVYATTNDIKIEFYDLSGTGLDVTTLTDTGNLNVMILYITDA